MPCVSPGVYPFQSLVAVSSVVVLLHHLPSRPPLTNRQKKNLNIHRQSPHAIRKRFMTALLQLIFPTLFLHLPPPHPTPVFETHGILKSNLTSTLSLQLITAVLSVAENVRPGPPKAPLRPLRLAAITACWPGQLKKKKKTGPRQNFHLIYPNVSRSLISHHHSAANHTER